MSRRIVVAVIVAFVAVLARAPISRGAEGTATGEWPVYGGDKGSTKYSPLDQINADNVKNLKIAWRQSAMPLELREGSRPYVVPANYWHTPLMVGGLLYMNTGVGTAAALDPGTGKVIWFDRPLQGEGAGPNKGLAYWSDGKEARVLTIVGPFLVAVHAKTGERVADFGTNGRLDLGVGNRRAWSYGFRWTSPPVIVRDVIVVGGAPTGMGDVATPQMPALRATPPGDIRGFDVRTGKHLWTFQVVPERGEFGYETWLNGSAEYSGNSGTWGPSISGDDELGHVYVATETPTGDYYGGTRPGDNLFAETLVALDAKTGKRIWHFQAQHHGLWDYDFTAAPILVDITVGGRKIKAIAEASKQAFLYVLDRVTGQPVWPIVERPVPAGKVPGEWYAKTQPFPTKPPAYDQQGMTIDDLIDFTPELRQRAIEKLKQYHYGPLFTPLVEGEPGNVLMPGTVGGNDWNGAGVDPETGIVYVPTVRLPVIMTLVPSLNPKSDIPFVRKNPTLSANLELEEGLPIVKPPYGSLVAIDLNKGDILWRIPNGDGPRNHPALKGLNLPPLGQTGRVTPLVTKTLVFLGEGGRRGVPRIGPWAGGKKFRAFDKRTGATMAEIELPGGATGAPMTYLHEGKQYIVVGVGWEDNPGELIALALP